MEQDTKIKILVVEDDISLKDSLVRLLQNRDFLVQAVENKQQAVEQIKSGQQYDIYLLDVWRTAMGLISVMKSGKFHRRL